MPCATSMLNLMQTDRTPDEGSQQIWGGMLWQGVSALPEEMLRTLLTLGIVTHPIMLKSGNGLCQSNRLSSISCFTHTVCSINEKNQCIRS